MKRAFSQEVRDAVLGVFIRCGCLNTLANAEQSTRSRVEKHSLAGWRRGFAGFDKSF
jgi:hypothetical protein